MIVPLRSSPLDTVVYPDSDGKPMAENTLQFRWIVTIQGGLDDLFRENPDVFVAGDLFWYPVEGKNKVCTAPDAMVVFGRPKGYRGSYQQWNEGGLAPQVVFEVLSPGNGPTEMARKVIFYERHGVEEYYIYDPDDVDMTGYQRSISGKFAKIPVLNGFTSPRLGIQFDLTGEELVIRRPDGRVFLTYLEQCEKTAQETQRADLESQRADSESQRADSESQRAEHEARRAEHEARRAEHEARHAATQTVRAEHETQRATAFELKLERLRAKMLAAGLDPDANGL